jgi:group I intron endonuclease
MKQVIYLFSFPNGKHYVGRTENFSNRLAEHKYNSKRRKYKLYNAINMYGWDNIDKKVIEEVVDLKDAIIAEYKNILKYDSINNGYNIINDTSAGGNVWDGRTDTQEYLEFCDKMKQINTGETNGMFGKTHTEEAKAKQKEKAKGRFSLPWFIEKYGEEEGTAKYKERNEALSNRSQLKGDGNPMRKPEVIAKRKQR